MTTDEMNKHASKLRDYARNCPAYEDGGPGLEESFCAGAEALETLAATAPQDAPAELGPHPNCPRCGGSGEASNAQFRCECRWSTSPLRGKAEILQEIDKQHRAESAPQDAAPAPRPEKS